MTNMEASVNDLRIRELRLRLHHAFEQRLERGALPYEGEWLAPDDVRRRQRESQLATHVQFWELLVGLAVLGAIGGFFLLVALLLIY